MRARFPAARLRRPEARRFAVFLLTGGCAAAVNIAGRATFSLVLPFAPAVALAYIVGMTTAFLLAKLFVFAGSGRRMYVEYCRFALVNGAALVQVLAVSVLLAKIVFPAIGFAWHADLIAHAIGVVSPVLLSYKGHKRFSFA